ncbi:L-lysine 6-transaminase [Candidatus Sumerlaeota bacterium]|nr:L-lysine 6-transaminase [Candidatus Sumerlaeota bacterium]
MTVDKNPILAAVRPYVVPIDTNTPVINWEKSQGARFYDDNAGHDVIDFSGHYASLPLGYNHPDFSDKAYETELLKVSKIKIANLDVLSESYAKFLATFRRVVGPPQAQKYFFVEGGALAVENTLKAAFDWKVHRNLRKGKGERGYEVIHFREAFHGRSGYTLSLTNTTDPNKIQYFPKFDWPRITTPKMRFPLVGSNLEQTLAAEQAAMKEIKAVFAAKADDIAAILIEPIQAEGGDNHFRREFLQFLRDMADEHDTMLIFDEVQTGMGITGKPWAYQSIGVAPDMVAFAKKAQMGGFFSNGRVLEDPKNVFTVPSRISSTWGASLTDMVRSTKYLEIMERENILANVEARGAQIMNLLHGIEERTELITNVRGRGLMIAFDLVRPDTRGQIMDALYDNGLMVLQCGDRSIRFRSHLNVTEGVVGEALSILEKTLLQVKVPAQPAQI